MEQSITLTRLADAVNLSEDTLNTYVSCGILRGERRDGEVFLSLAEIQTIFGDIAVSRIAVQPASSSSENPPEPTPLENTESESSSAEPEDSTANTDSSSAASEAEAILQPPSPPALSPELLSIAASLREQIEQLKQERDWLRTRIEHLESRSDRDQMLILSQSENVRKLISPSPRKSWLNLLPWYRGD